ncbi:MAG: phosphopantetheine-binding protein [Prevotellaceae bacterium]|jgi:acyl carrier protein|nr:phosphopantetheine-binding protein [Prevotellaceae bacterium]
MEKIELINKVNAALAEEFEIEISTLVPEANIKETLDIDSLGLVDMVALIEGLFGVKIQGHEIANIMTFENLYDYIYAKLNDSK